MEKRQNFFSETHYNNFQGEHDETIELLKSNNFESESPVEEAAIRSRHLQTLALDRLLAAYTAGEEIESLTPLLSDLIDKYEVRQATLEEHENLPNIPPLAIDDWPDEYEECLQAIGFCVLLHRTDLLKRFVKINR